LNSILPQNDLALNFTLQTGIETKTASLAKQR